MNGFLACDSLAKLRSARKLPTEGNTEMALSLLSQAAFLYLSAPCKAGSTGFEIKTLKGRLVSAPAGTMMSFC